MSGWVLNAGRVLVREVLSAEPPLFLILLYVSGPLTSTFKFLIYYLS